MLIMNLYHPTISTTPFESPISLRRLRLHDIVASFSVRNEGLLMRKQRK